MNSNPSKLDVTKTASIVVAVVAVISLIGGSLFWMGYVSGQVEEMDEKVQSLEVDIRDMRNEMQTMRSELLEEIRRGNDQMLEALYNHTHDDDGDAVFRRPPLENP